MEKKSLVEAQYNRHRQSGKPIDMRIRRLVISTIFSAPLLCSVAQAEETHSVKTSAAKATVGIQATVTVTIEGRNGWHINSEAPIALKISTQTGANVAKPKQSRADLVESSETKARFDVSATLIEVGNKSLGAEATFVMCQESACKPVKETFTLTFATEAPSAPVPNVKAKGKRKV